ncbi:MAG TPA: energy transducer TonB [Candidatus Aquilonibacter sp.]|jgi:protein TonB|nr:energy transducer TonB [Candidatus Aquilonibacter sp.]
MSSVDLKLNPVEDAKEPELNLLLAPDTFEPLWKSLFTGIDEFFFPKKLPPLKLESKPVPVKDIWGFYNYKKNGALGSTAAHIVVIALIIGGTIWVRRLVPKVEAKPASTTQLIDPGDFIPLKPAATQAGGGGGGGDHDVLQASRGHLPKFSMQPQITPPTAIIRNLDPKLAVEPTVMVPPEIKVAMNNLPTIGDPKSSAIIPSNGTGSQSGIGSGEGGGIGPGNGRGVGPGEGMGIGGGVFRPGRGVTPPRPIYSPDPEFSEEARKAKYQGTCTLMIVVSADGKPTNIRVVNSLGMGLDEKAIETVRTWRFEPGMKDGHPVNVEMAVEVDFHLY